MLPTTRSRRLLPLIVASAAAFLARDAAGFGPIVATRQTVLSVGQPIRVVLSAAVAPVGGAWNGTVHYDEVAEENGELRRRVAELEGRLAGQDDLESDLQALLQATEIDYLGDTERVTARVVADRRSAIERIVELDKGTDDGIARGMPVVTGSGLVGTVEVVTGDRAVVRLMTDGDVSVGVRSDNGLGLAVGRRGATMGLLATPELAEAIRLGAVVDGERFVTSGIDRSLYPAGIPVGVLKIESPPGDESPGANDADGPNTDGLDTGANSDDSNDSDATSPPNPAGPSRSLDQLSYETLDTLEVTLQPLAEIDQLSYLTVLLIDPAA